MPTLSVVCQAERLTERYIIELEQDRIFPNQSFSIKPAGTPSDIFDPNGFTEPDSSPDDTPRRSWGYRVKTTMIESIAWQSLYATQLLAAYERTLTIKVTPLSNTPYSWLTAEAAVAIIWLLKSRWNPGSSSLNPVGQEEASQDYPFATITMM
ncbi:hypothetical protein, partial [Endozoicomonas sp. SESOKO3]|uniref:hypothetical protein n=1 Tax=Endozoicomonas sp. SESOKO3 TaxID=2828744 RepID=UPI0021490C91